MISKSLSTSEKRAALHDEAGKLAEFCQAIYPLLVAHADDWGCLPGDVFTIKHLIDPSSPRKLPDFARALMHMHNVGLITWYDADDNGVSKRVVYVCGFAAHQQLKGHDKDGRKRTYPEPPENISRFDVSAQNRPNPPKPALRELNLTELKRTYVQSPPADATGTEEAIDPDLDQDAVSNRDIGAFISRFCELYAKYRHGAKYLVKRHKHIPTVRLLLRVYDSARLEKLASVLLMTDDEWVSGTDRGIDILSVKASWLDGLLSDYEAKHGKVPA